MVFKLIVILFKAFAKLINLSLHTLNSPDCFDFRLSFWIRLFYYLFCNPFHRPLFFSFCVNLDPTVWLARKSFNQVFPNAIGNKKICWNLKNTRFLINLLNIEISWVVIVHPVTDIVGPLWVVFVLRINFALPLDQFLLNVWHLRFLYFLWR